MSRQLPNYWGRARDVGAEPSKLTGFGKSQGSGPNIFLVILAISTAFLSDFGDRNELFRFEMDF